MNVIDGLLNAIESIKTRVYKLEMRSFPEWIYLAAPLTSASYDGDDSIVVGTVTIDTSATFAAPVGIKAVLLHLRCNWAAADSASRLLLRRTAGGTDGPEVVAQTTFSQNLQTVMPCDANGDFAIVVANADALNVRIRIWGYMV